MQLFAMALLLYSCSENETPISDTTDNQARLNFLIKTAPTNKALIHGDDGSFSSLALYIFNKADSNHIVLQKYFLLDCLSPFVHEYSI